jgi:hypothetical protein
MWKREDSKVLEAALVWAFTIIFVYIIIQSVFWLFIVSIIILLLYLTHIANKDRGWYNSKYWYKATILFLISLVTLFIWWSQLLYNRWKIDATFFWRAMETGNWISIKHKKWKIRVEPDPSGAILESLQERR